MASKGGGRWLAPIGFGYQIQALSEIRSDALENAHRAAFFSSLLDYLLTQGLSPNSGDPQLQSWDLVHRTHSTFVSLL